MNTIYNYIVDIINGYYIWDMIYPTVLGVAKQLCTSMIIYVQSQNKHLFPDISRIKTNPGLQYSASWQAGSP
jgi:hypothetical protein